MRFGTAQGGGEIKGDCEVKGYENWIVVDSFDFSVGRKIEAAEKGGGRDIQTGAADPQEVSITKNVDRATPYLMFRAVQDRSPGNANNPVSVDLHCVETQPWDYRVSKGGMAKSETKSDLKAYLKICLGRALIKSWSISADEDNRPTETLSIWFNQVAVLYRQMKIERDSKGETPTVSFIPYGPKGWDQLAGGKGGDWEPPHWKKSR
jgi:type VI secretion system secreted protein Hcp